MLFPQNDVSPFRNSIFSSVGKNIRNIAPRQTEGGRANARLDRHQQSALDSAHADPEDANSAGIQLGAGFDPIDGLPIIKDRLFEQRIEHLEAGVLWRLFPMHDNGGITSLAEISGKILFQRVAAPEHRQDDNDWMRSSGAGNEI